MINKTMQIKFIDLKTKSHWKTLVVHYSIYFDLFDDIGEAAKWRLPVRLATYKRYNNNIKLMSF